MASTIRGSDNFSTQGTVVQVVHTQSSAVSTATAQIPSDNTIPQNTEGTEVLTLSITPKSATNRLRIEWCIHTGISSGASVATALFQDSTANALFANVTFLGGVVVLPLFGSHEMAAGTTSATTFKVRVGPTSAATLTFNGSGGLAIFGGVLLSHLRITEISV